MALNGTVLVDVRNISSSKVVYDLPELNVNRAFTPGEVKKISVKELRTLKYAPSGDYLMSNYLSIQNPELLEEFGIVAEPEYFWTTEDVKALLVSNDADAVDRLKDALEFAPDGIVESIQGLAISMEIDNMSKRQAITDATGFNITSAINMNHADNEEEVVEETVKSKRRVPVATS